MANISEKEQVDVTIDTGPDYDSITLTFVSDNQTVSVGFSIEEAQMLSSWINEAVTTVSMHKLGITPSKTKH